jgi:hypothetical protein
MNSIRYKFVHLVCSYTLGFTTAVGVVLLTGCASLPQGTTGPSKPAFQGSVGKWDREVDQDCRALAIIAVVEALKQVKTKPSDELVQEALDSVYGQCLQENGRAI